MHKNFWKKITSCLSIISLFINVLSPLALTQVYAADATAPAEIVETVTPSTVPTEVPSPTTIPSITPEATPSQTEAPTPTIIPPVPTETTVPTPNLQLNEQSSGSSSPEQTADPSPIPTATVTIEPTPTTAEKSEPEQGELTVIVVADSSVDPLTLDLGESNIASAQLVTDKADYAPTETVVISGNEFKADTDYILIITSSDEPSVNFQTQITTNSEGSFIYSYQLDGNYRPNYSVEVKDLSGTVVATITFTDANPAGDLEQCRNNSSSTPSNCIDLGGGSGWVKGNAGSSQAHYVEGFSAPYREVMTNLPTGTPITITLGYDIKHSNKHAIDFLTHYDRLQPHSVFGHSAETIDPVDGVSGVASTTTTFPIPAPSSVGSPISGQPTTSFNSLPAGERLMTLFGGTINNVAYVSEGNLSDAQSETRIAITFTADNSTAVLAWGGHITREIDWGINNSAGGISGSPYHMRQISWTIGNLGNQDRSLSAGAIAPPSSIKIIKDSSPDGSQDFSFITSGNGLSNFTLDDDGGSEGTYSNAATFNSLLAGTYTITETQVSGWTLSSRNCVSDGTGSTSTQITDGVSINLVAGENITCTFINDKQEAHLTLQKTVTNDNGGNAVATAWTLAASGPTSISGITGNAAVTNAAVNSGTYTLSESGGPSGYAAGAWNCVKNGGDPVSGSSITLAGGDSAICTITNNDIQPKLTVTKVVVNDNGGTNVVADFPLFVGATSVTSGVQNGFNAGTYTVSETNQSGYSAVISGDCAGNGSITLSIGDVKSCTITNNDQAGTLIVKKVVVNDNGGTKDVDDFSFSVNGATASAFEADGQNNLSVNAGIYNVTEPEIAGYTTTYDNCSDLNIPNGGSQTCTITNDDQAGTLTVKKIIINDNGGILSEGDFSFQVGTGSAVPFEADGQNDLTIDAGTYTITEPAVSGYSTTYENCRNVVVENGGSATCTITNNDIAPTLKLVKLVTNNNGGTASASAWTLAATGEGGFSDAGNSTTFHAVNAGVGYVLSESAIDGYDAGSWSCDGGSLNGSTVTLGLNQSVTCTIANNDQTPSLHLRKTITNDNGGTASTSAWTLTATGTGGSPTNLSGNTPVDSGSNFKADTYALGESGGPSGYTAGAWDCGDAIMPDATHVTVPLGGDVTCIITNNDNVPSLTLQKIVVNDNGGTQVASDWSLYATAGSVGIGGIGPNVYSDATFSAGTYILSETGPSGYTPSAWVCVGGSQTGDEITLDLGQTATCTITNDDLAGTLIVKKVVINDNGGTKGADDFSFSVNEATSAAFEADGQNDLTVSAGIYNVSEAEVVDYSTSYDNCSDLNIPNGDSQTCTITNDDIAPTLTLVKTVITDDGGTATQDDFDVYINTELSSWGTQTLAAGSYIVSEATSSGYTSSAWGTDCASDGTITLSVGDTKTCSITNDDQPGKISGKKFNDLNGDHLRTNATTDPNLSGWTITLDKVEDVAAPVCVGGSVVGELCVKTTNSFGNYLFTDLTPGTYKVSEVLQAGWIQTRPGLFNSTLYGGQGAQADGSYILTINSGTEIDDRDFGNQGRGKIILNKVTNPAGSTQTFDFQLRGTATGSATLADGGSQTFSDLPAGSYTLSEEYVSDWTLADIDCGEEGSREGSLMGLTLNAGEEISCTFTNTRDTGTVIVHKAVDQGEGYIEDDAEASKLGFRWTLDNDLDYEMGATASAVTGDHSINEVEAAGYVFTGWFDSDSDYGCSRPQGITLPIAIPVEKDQLKNITLCNRLQDPSLLLSKSNNKSGIDVSPGAQVLYTLVVEATGSAVDNVKVKDLLPDGFEYAAGSWTAYSSTRGDLKAGGITGEPTYASPGTWTLGDMDANETVTLTFLADISSTQEAGLYKDVAWAQGASLFGDQVLATALDPSAVDTNFAGTEVNVTKNSPSAEVTVEKEEIRQGEVLGLTTSMPETGTDNIWVIISSILFIIGLGLLGTGLKLRKRYV